MRHLGAEGYNVPEVVCDIYFAGVRPCLGGLCLTLHLYTCIWSAELSTVVTVFFWVVQFCLSGYTLQRQLNLP